jgi:hypothetical protein
MMVQREIFKTHAMQMMLVGMLVLSVDPSESSRHRAMPSMHAMEQEEILRRTPSLPI